MNANEVIANKANEILGQKLGSYTEINPNDHVNMSQSTNDTYPTVMRLATLALSHELLIELELFSNSFGAKALEFDHILKAGRTHLQDAVPIRLGQEFGAYKYTIDQLIKLIVEAQSSLQVLGIGGSAVGTGINVPKGYREYILDELQILFHDKNLSLAPNLIAAMQSQLPMMIYSNALKATALELTRIMNDLRLLSSGPSTGLGEITLPPSQPGSSIMPGKINPSLLEMGNQVFFKVLGNDNAMAFAIQAGQLELNVMMPLMAQLSLESTHLMKNALHSIRERCIDGIKANISQCEKYLGQTSQLATALSPLIGYAKAAELANESLSANKSILELIKEKKILTDEQFKTIFNFKEMTEPK
jgi:aspartate ammonia-lyase